jgi:hypothetical protein
LLPGFGHSCVGGIGTRDQIHISLAELLDPVVATWPGDPVCFGGASPQFQFAHLHHDKSWSGLSTWAILRQQLLDHPCDLAHHRYNYGFDPLVVLDPQKEAAQRS